MPTYDYSCPNGHSFELFQRMSDPPPAGCAVCGAGPVERVFSPVAVHFKGSGFYSTDYGRGGAKKRDGDKDGGAGGESKPGADKPAPAQASSAPAPSGGSSSASSSSDS